MDEKAIRQVVAYKRYFLDFYQQQPKPAQRKIEWILNLCRRLDRIPEKYFRHLTGTTGLYEIRIEWEGNIFRVFAFFDKGNLIVLGNGFRKKTAKTPAAEIERALNIKAEYENEKRK